MLRILVLSAVFTYGLCATPYLPYRRPNGPEHSPRILDGQDANEGQFPYMLSLNYVGDGHACGASVLTSRWALTAAHCCLTGSDTEIFGGTIYLNGNGQKTSIREYIVHENYDPNQNWRNDICLLHLANDLQLNDRVQQITLPTQGWPVNDGDKLTITGWGYTTDDSQEQHVPNRLQIGSNWNALSNDHCGQLAGMNVYEGNICCQGTHQGQGVCNGDSGGPLVKDGVQVGITSWVFLPCGSGLPDFYTRVPNYIDWIKQKLGNDANQLKFV